jgi:phosphate starvation-inducible PhoH-like protein
MNRKMAKRSQNNQRHQPAQAENARIAERPAEKRDTTPITPLNAAQKRYLSAMRNFVLTFATGPAGTGKTFLCSALAAQMLESGEIKKIIITRPAVEAGESMGFLPGEIEDKFGPYLQPFRDTLDQRLGKSFVEYLIKRGVIEATPLAYMRGRSFRDAFIILDESQNTTPVQMKMFLTRIGQDCRVVVNGDIRQKDISGVSGLEDAISRVTHIPTVKHVEFRKADIVRSGLCQEIISCYED